MMFLLLHLLGLLVPTLSLPSLEVVTASGPVRGGWLPTTAGGRLASFQGLPFAAPPVGERRFAPPHPVEPWTEELDLSGVSEVKCPQYGFMADGGVPQVTGDEDCLYLNVYVPESAGPEHRLPVMMWVFGGYFTAGSGRWEEYGAMNWADQEVIIVAPNHRLGPLGFTSLGVPEAPGNQGLRDLVAALEWIQTNIAEFGGDPGSVTIFGESSGSWACSYLHMSPLAAGLFHRAILQSGSLLNPFWLPITEADAVAQSTFLGDAFGCYDMTVEERLQCLRALDRDTLLESMNWGVPETLNIQKMFRPTGVIEGDFLPDWPEELVARGEYNHVDLMVGYTKDEALIQTLQLEMHPELYPLLAFQWTDVFGPMFLFGRYGPDITQQDRDMAAVFANWYLGGPPLFNINQQHFQNITDMISDAYIWYGAHREARGAAAQGDTVFQYQFNFKGVHGYPEAITGSNEGYGVCHSDELYYFWRPYWNKATLDLVGFTPEEAELSRNVLEMWSNFARTGDPTPGGSPVAWTPVTPEAQQYLVIDTTLEMALSPEYLARMALWDENYQHDQADAWAPPPVDIIHTTPHTDNVH